MKKFFGKWYSFIKGVFLKFMFTRREFMKIFLVNFILFYSIKSLSGNQKEINLSNSVSTLMKNSINDVNPPYLIYPNKSRASHWFRLMDLNLSRFIKDNNERYKILLNINYESSRSGLNPQLVLGLIEVESKFNRYAVSDLGAIGLMQVMPFWVKYIGNHSHNLFDIRTNLRYGCTILKFYFDLEKGDLFRALGRYNGSLGKTKYPELIFHAYKNNWYYE